MFNKIKLFILFFTLVLTFSFANENVFAATTSAPAKVPATCTLKAVDVVKTPGIYLNKDIKLNAKFVAFSSLGLDYPKAMRSSKDYVGFLIMRDDTPADVVIPLSELKLFMKRSLAEKYVDLEQGDVIEVQAHIFSTALGDAWGDISTLSVIEKVKKKK